MSLADHVSVPDDPGVDRSRTTAHDWVRRADLRHRDGQDPNRVAVDETVMRVNDQRYRLYAAVDPATNRPFHVHLFPTGTAGITEMVLAELRGKRLVDDAVFPVDGASGGQAVCHYLGLRSYHVTRERRNAAERVFRGFQRELRRSLITSDALSGKPPKRGHEGLPSAGTG